VNEYKDEPLISFGVVAHSIRAMDLQTLGELIKYAHDTKRPFHMHVEEQPKEI